MSSIMNSGIYTKALEIAEQAVTLAGIDYDEVKHAINTKRNEIKGCASESDAIAAAFPVFMMAHRPDNNASMYYALMAVFVACTEPSMSVVNYVRGYAAKVH